MRLKQDEVAAIKACAARHFGPAAVVTLFGSRVDDNKRGGDIDLHIVPETAARGDFRHEAAFLNDLQKAIGERRIDIVLQLPGDVDTPVDRIARTSGIQL